MTRAPLVWSNVPGSLRGPYHAPPGAAETAFEVVSVADAHLRFGRLSPGPAWPAALPPLDRFAALPEPAPGALDAAPASAVVLAFSQAGETPRPLCVRLPNGTSAWSVDPVAWIRRILDEDYVLRWKRPLPSFVPFVNYARTPFLVKGLLTRLQDPARASAPPPLPFPDPALDTFVEQLRRLCAALAWGSGAIAAELWPGGALAAVAVTHDVDSGWLLDPAREKTLRRILDGERELGFPGTWFVVAAQVNRRTHAPALRRIQDAGHELGAHGWNHDGRLQYLGSHAQEARMQKIAQRLAGLGVSGMRTPWYARSRGLFDVIAGRFAYDSSVPSSSDFFSAQTRSGCASLLPYEARPGLFELPMTLPPDTALPVERRRRVLGELADTIVAQRGVVVVTLHPQPHQSATDAGLDAHFGLLRDLAARHPGRLWCATAAEVVERYRSCVSA